MSIDVTPVVTIKMEPPSEHWSVRLQREGTAVRIALHWRDKDNASHHAYVPFDKFKRAIATLED